MAAFRKRITPNVKNAGFEIDWQASIDDISADYRPRDLLQIFRILQEAVTNALKHSGGDKIDIIAGPSDAPEFVWQIQVIDDGIGFNARKGRGRGLGNMDVRADSIGAKLTVLDGQTGTIVKLDLPEISQEPR